MTEDPKDQEQNTESDEEEKGSRIVFGNTHNLSPFFKENKLSLIVTTYQAGRILLFTSPTGEKLSMLMRKLPRPTGCALGKKQLAVASRHQIWFFGAAKNLTRSKPKEGEEKTLPHDLVFIPRRSHVTGYIDAHQLVWQGDKLLIVNTLFSCISRLEEDWSFTPIWWPKFISKVLAEDRCHLNGMCLDRNGPKYATALGQTDEPEGWRENKAEGGILIDIPSNEVIATGFSMPHSPHLYDDKLFLLESGTGSLLIVEPKSGKRQTLFKFGTFLRGLAFYKQYAFVGLCKAREKKSFGSLPIEDDNPDFRCGISVIDLNSLKEVGFIIFQGGVEELFDIVVLPGFQDPHIIGFEGEDIDQIKIFQNPTV